MREQRQFRPLFYDLADEAGIGDLAAAWDADISASSLAAMRDWLRTQYPSLAALNAQWGKNFAAWDEVVPELTDEAMRRTDGNYSAWADFKAWMDVAFARAVRTGTDAVHQADPDALAGLEGLQLPGWGGYDYSLLAGSADVLEVYPTGHALDMVRAFAPRTIPLRTSFGAGPYEWHAAWQHLLHGGRGLIVWDEADNVVAADGSPGLRGRDLAAMVAALRQVAPEVLASQPEYDAVGVLISQASFRTSWLLDHRLAGAAWSDRDAAREYEDNAWLASRREILERLAGIGVQPHLLSSAMLEAGALGREGIRVLFLPHAIALSAQEASEIAAFKAAGGTVLADTEPGLFDQHSRLLAAPLPAGVVTVPEAMQRTGVAPTPGTLEGIAALLRAAGIVPRAVFRSPVGAAAPGLDVRWLRQGESELLAIQAVTPYAAPPEIDIELAAPARVRDLRRGGEAVESTRFKVALDPFQPTILSLTR
ncbi:MAG: beta-galactosidase [Acetobacteraceae bacterium]|nr:beta-galactosidase [Acetobacteraceae bacterium]